MISATAHLRRIAMAVAGASALTGCAVSYVDADGTRHLWGIGHLYLRGPSAQTQSTVSGTDTLGVSVSKTADGVEFGVGLLRSRRVEIPNATAMETTCLVNCDLSRLDAKEIRPKGEGTTQ
jgi:hypothetical protein